VWDDVATYSSKSTVNEPLSFELLQTGEITTVIV